MSRVYSQTPHVVLETSASLAALTSISGCLICDGYSRLVGMAISNASSTGSGLRIFQSSTRGTTWDSETLYTITACTGSSFDIPIYGNGIKVTASNGATAASLLRAYFSLRAIGGAPT